MTIHLEQDLENISSRIYEMADLVSESISRSLESLNNADMLLAQKVIDDDSRLDNLEIEIDNRCIRIIVTRQPAAIHLRFVLALLKINTDLERMGDMATSIARESLKLNGSSIDKLPPDISSMVSIGINNMATIGIEMLKDSFQAISEKNVEKARKVIKKDMKLDEIYFDIYGVLFSYMAEKSKSISEALGHIMIAKALERIGDHAMNIAERAIYYIEGIDIRHSSG